MRHPYQCLALTPHFDVSSGEDQVPITYEGQFLLAACGSSLCNFDIETGKLVGRWPEDKVKDEGDNSDSSTEIITGTNEPSDRARKRRKTKNKGVDDNIGGAITRLVTSTRKRGYVVAATGEDKSIHVFQICKDGQLKHLSQRRMTKRPCAIALTPEEDFVLVGDKFGDVYALPLEVEDAASLSVVERLDESATKPVSFRPSATNLTVHTQRNLKALKNQMVQSNSSSGAKPREAMNFAHDLLLGHVSMLTDLVSARVPSPSVPNANRDYIVTCDRDEHIRISRGRQQAHIVENYCFGHTQFVSKLCVLDDPPSILVSGGGDECLYVWDWLEGQLLGKLPIQQLVQRHFSRHTDQRRHANQGPLEAEEGEDSSVNEAIAVSGLWRGIPMSESSLQVWCSCEGVAALFQFTFQLDRHRKFSEDDIISCAYELPGNPLSMVVNPRGAIVSVDVVHDAGSTTSVQQVQENDNGNQHARLVQIVVSHDATGSPEPLSLGRDEGPVLSESQIQKLGALLYGMENLRKHSNEEAE